MIPTTTLNSPDKNGTGLLPGRLDPKRYESFEDDPKERSGILHKFMPSHARILDVGCGTGSLSLIVNRDKDNSIFGIEPDPVRAEIANSRGLRTSCGYLTAEYLAASGPFDAVMLADVLEHLPNPAELLALARSCLCPQGSLLVSVPNAVHWTVRWSVFLGRFEYAECGIRDVTHLRWFTAATIVRLIETCGFKVDHIEQSVGASLPEYSTSWPWRKMKFTHRGRVLKMLTRIAPSLFGCQHVVLAHKL